MSVSVVIPTHNRAPSLARLLQALRCAEQPAGGLEIVVVDDGSTDSTPDVACGADLRYLRQRNAGPAAARENGWRAARGDRIVFLDDDCMPARDAVVLLARALDDADGVGARILPVTATALVPGFMQAEGLVDHRVGADGGVRWLVTAAAAFRREALERVGGFDVTFTDAAGEDVDLTQRLLASGARLRLEPRAVVLHDHRTRLSHLFRMYYRRGRVQRRLTTRHRAIRADSTRNASAFFMPSAWRDQYRRYRRAAPAARSMGYAALRAATAFAYVAGALRPMPTDGLDQTRRDDLSRLLDSVRIFRNWPQVVATIALQRIGWPLPELRAVTRRGFSIESRNEGLSRAPIYQVLADDDYGLTEMAAECAGKRLNIVDIGAHVGSYTIAVCERLPAATVTAYEPAPSAFAYLARNVASNRLDQRVAIRREAVSGSTGSVTLFEAGDASCLSSTVAARAPRGARRRTVPCVSLDEVMAQQRSDIDVLKIDCEGAEYEIVRSSTAETWQRVRRVVMEFHDVPGESRQDVQRCLAEHGFVMLALRPSEGGLGVATFARPDAA